MARVLRFALVWSVTVMVTACGGGSSPTAPTPVASSPIPTASNPAPAPASVAGIWLNNGSPMMTLTQNGTSVSGTLVPATVDFHGIVSVVSGNITGTVSGTSVTLAYSNVVTARTGTQTLVCRGADSFNGQVAGNSISGTFISSTTPYVCEGGLPMPSAQLSGPMIFNRQ